jgi:hypothetical protein
MPPFFMIYLNTNTAGQLIYLTLDEARQWLQPYTHYLVGFVHEENGQGGEALYQVANVLLENQRFTKLDITTIGLTLRGRYRYFVWAQNSATNVDPTNGVVVGLAEEGLVELLDATTFYNVSEPTINNDIIYNG